MTIPPSVVGAVVSVVLGALLSWVAWSVRQLRKWTDEQTHRTEANEVRSHANRRVLDDTTDRDMSDEPPADDPAADRLGPITDGGQPEENTDA